MQNNCCFCDRITTFKISLNNKPMLLTTLHHGYNWNGWVFSTYALGNSTMPCSTSALTAEVENPGAISTGPCIIFWHFIPTYIAPPYLQPQIRPIYCLNYYPGCTSVIFHFLQQSFWPHHWRPSSVSKNCGVLMDILSACFKFFDIEDALQRQGRKWKTTALQPG